jgi:hypothetical protein
MSLVETQHRALFCRGFTWQDEKGKARKNVYYLPSWMVGKSTKYCS